MSGLAEGVSILLTLTQAAIQASTAAAEVATLVSKAQAEGRDLTEAELDTARNAALAARAKLE